MPTVNLGRVKPIHRGEYSAVTEYRPLDIITYKNNTYFCIATSTGNLPTDTDYFEPIVDINSGTIATFTKADPDAVAWTKRCAGTAETRQRSTWPPVVEPGRAEEPTSTTMPTLTAGTDYAIWAKTDGTLEASSNHTTPPAADELP